MNAAKTLPSNQVPCKLAENGRDMIADLQVNSANQQQNNPADMPSALEIMRDVHSVPSLAETSDTNSYAEEALLHVESELTTTASIDEIPDFNQKRNFALIATLLLALFTFIALYTTGIFRQGSFRSVNIETPLSLAKLVTFAWSYFVIATSASITLIKMSWHSLPTNLSVITGIILITMILNAGAEQLNFTNGKPQLSNGFLRDLLRKQQKWSILKIQYLLFTLFHFCYLIIPSWLQFELLELPVWTIALQAFSSLLFILNTFLSIPAVRLTLKLNSKRIHVHQSM